MAPEGPPPVERIEDDPDAEPPASDALPLAIAALSVDGRCRERNPADLAIFGAEADRFVHRFRMPAAGQALLARAIETGTAETDAVLETEAGPGPFRVALWRQRGGERIRVLAVFSQSVPVSRPAPRADEPPPCADRPGSLDADRMRVAAELRGPTAAVLGLAAELRAGDLAEGTVHERAGDIAAAGWRLARIAAALDAGGETAAPKFAEVDPVALLGRLCRLAVPSASAAGTELVMPARSPAPTRLVVSDPDRLWAALELLLQGAIRAAGQGGRVEAVCRTDPDGGVAIDLSDTGVPGEPDDAPAAAPPPWPLATAEAAPAPRLAPFDHTSLAALLTECGAQFSLEGLADGGTRVRIVFPPARCLDAP
ncbi:MAG: hypothetical protein ACFBSD_08440 [Paracoccaceae bacterium]